MNHCQVIDPDFSMKTLNGRELKCVQDYKYLGSFISSSEKDFKTRKGMAWTACNNLHNVLTSSFDDKIKINTFKTMIEPILLYGSETWTLNARQQQRLDGTYTRLLMLVRNISWRSHPTLQTIYGDLPRVSQVLWSRRVQFAGHCFRATNEVVSPLILWKSRSVGRRSRKLTYPDAIARDSGIRFYNLSVAMQDRNTWRDIVRSISTAVERWWWWWWKNLLQIYLDLFVKFAFGWILIKLFQQIITRIRVPKCDTNVKQNPIGLKRSIVTSLRLLFHGINR